MFSKPRTIIDDADAKLNIHISSRPGGGTVDTGDLKSLASNGVRVRLPPRAPAYGWQASMELPQRDRKTAFGGVSG